MLIYEWSYRDHLKFYYTHWFCNYFTFIANRDPAKRKVKPVEPQSLLDFDLGEGESSDDSDFRIEDHPEESDDYSINTDDDKS